MIRPSCSSGDLNLGLKFPGSGMTLIYVKVSQGGEGEVEGLRIPDLVQMFTNSGTG